MGAVDDPTMEDDKMEKLTQLALDAREAPQGDDESSAAFVARIARVKMRRLETWGYASNSAASVQHLYR